MDTANQGIAKERSSSEAPEVKSRAKQKRINARIEPNDEWGLSGPEIDHSIRIVTAEVGNPTKPACLILGSRNVPTIRMLLQDEVLAIPEGDASSIEVEVGKSAEEFPILVVLRLGIGREKECEEQD